MINNADLAGTGCVAFLASRDGLLTNEDAGAAERGHPHLSAIGRIGPQTLKR